MARRRFAMQTEATPATILSPAELQREKSINRLKQWLECNGYRWSKLPHYGKGGRRVGDSPLYVGPRCKNFHDGGGLGGAIRWTRHHGCVECQLHLVGKLDEASIVAKHW